MKISLALAISLTIISFILGLVGGYFITPNYQQEMVGTREMTLGKADKWVDLRYIKRMIAHHRGALLLAEEIQQMPIRTELQEISKDIQANEPALIGELYSWKHDWFGDYSIVSDPVIPKIGTADEKLDLRILNALIAHHQDGMQMTKEIRTKSVRSQILDNADAIEQSLMKSTASLSALRKEWFNVE